MKNQPAPIQFTRKGYEKLESDLKRLEKYREEVLVRLQAAREMGDLSENGAYTAAKFEQGQVDHKLRHIRHQLKYGVVAEKKNSGKIDFGNYITLKNSSHEIEFTLVSKFESNPAKQMLSTESPLGQAVLGKKLGDTITVQAPAGDVKYTITKVS